MEVTSPQGQASTSNDTLGKFSLLTILLVTVLLIGGMIADKQRVALAFICGVTFFTVFGGMVIFVLSGQLASIIINHQKERTVRLRDRMQYEIYSQPSEQISLVQPQRLEDRSEIVEKGEIDTPQLHPTFVPAVPSVEEGIKITSYEFVYNLYEGGSLNPAKVLPEGSKSPGQIQYKKPRPEVVDYLLALGMIKVGDNKMLFFNYKLYPTLREAQRAIKHGVREGYR